MVPKPGSIPNNGLLNVELLCYVIHTLDVQLGRTGGVKSPTFVEVWVIISLYGLGQFSPHELDF